MANWQHPEWHSHLERIFDIFLGRRPLLRVVTGRRWHSQQRGYHTAINVPEHRKHVKNTFQVSEQTRSAPTGQSRSSYGTMRQRVRTASASVHWRSSPYRIPLMTHIFVHGISVAQYAHCYKAEKTKPLVSIQLYAKGIKARCACVKDKQWRTCFLSDNQTSLSTVPPITKIAATVMTTTKCRASAPSPHGHAVPAKWHFSIRWLPRLCNKLVRISPLENKWATQILRKADNTCVLHHIFGTCLFTHMHLQGCTAGEASVQKPAQCVRHQTVHRASHCITSTPLNRRVSKKARRLYKGVITHARQNVHALHDALEIMRDVIPHNH